jgi:GrpB-like predicted nucleotidyltransferase (UPF0157 family)
MPEETLQERIRRVTAEQIELAPYDPSWPARFEAEAAHLRACLPADILGRIEHVGSTAVPGLKAKPVIDMLVEVADLEATRRRIVPLLESQGYEYFWRPTIGDEPPFYAWFIKRDAQGARTHHIHMVEPDFAHWERLLFRDWLIAHPSDAARYAALKEHLAAKHAGGRVAYTKGKTAFIREITERAKEAAGADS